MERFVELGAEYGEWRPDRARVWSSKGQLHSHLGAMTLPPGVEWLLFTRLNELGPFKVAGKDHEVGNAWEWDGVQWVNRGLSNGSSGFIFDFGGVLHVITPGPNVTSQGYRYVDASGQLIGGDATYGPYFGINEYTDLGDGLRIGQGNDAFGLPTGVVVLDGTVPKLLELGFATFIRANRLGDVVAISFSTPSGVVFIMTTIAGLKDLPVITVAAPPPVNNPAPLPVPIPVPVPQPCPMPMPVPFDWSQLRIIGDAPDVRGWAETTHITRVELSSAGVGLDFEAKARWPDVTTPGWDGPLQYTLWFAQQIDSVWYATGVIEYWRGLVAYGGDVTAPDQFGKNWVYFASPLHQPLVGETIGFFVTAGDQRKKDVHTVAERSNVVTFPWNGRADVFTFGDVQMPPIPVPVPPTVPTPPTAPVSIDLTEVVALLTGIKAAIIDADTHNVAKLDELKVSVIHAADSLEKFLPLLAAGGGLGSLGGLLGGLGKKK